MAAGMSSPLMNPTATHDIAVIAGDGIGPEVVPVAIEIVELATSNQNVKFTWKELPWNCERFLREGSMMPADGLDQLAEHDAILLGAVGWPSVPDHISLWGLLIPIRRRFKQYINLRPIRLFEGIQSPIASLKSGEFNMCIVRENNEGEYSQIGGRLYQGTPEEIVIQESVFTVRGVDRTLRYAFELASSRAGKLTSATKSNGIVHTMPFWDERVGLMSKEFPNIEVEEVHIDALAAFFVQRPHTFDVVVGSNLFGDILSDLAAAVAGSIGIAPAANINPEKEHPSMFEPVHGSAPDIAGRGIANPIGQIWSAAMMLDHLGYSESARKIEVAISDALVNPTLHTPDLGGKAKTKDILAFMRERLA
jgi:tartrate dehydrogenase/decarboxylase/D-malate dehydrogenase